MCKFNNYNMNSYIMSFVLTGNKMYFWEAVKHLNKLSAYVEICGNKLHGSNAKDCRVIAVLQQNLTVS